MHGKATLILTDKDTGRVVEQIEEHNMVTNALNSIFNLPPEMVYDTTSKYSFLGYLPMYRNILKGLVLFGDTIPENADDYMLGGKYSVIATAGDEYSGADAMRGSFNANQSCEIENGYRFVWDFAPEKAIGTIKSLSLTHRLHGNRGDLALSGANSYYMIHSTDLSNENNSGVAVVRGSGTFFLQNKTALYSYTSGSNFIIIRKYVISDKLGLKIGDTKSASLVNETKLTLSFTPGYVSYDPTTQRLYAIIVASKTVNSEKRYAFRYIEINPETCEKETETEYIVTSLLYESNGRLTFYGGKVYIISSDRSINVCSRSGVFENTISTGLYSISGFQRFDGKLAVEGKLSSSGRTCIYILDEPKNQLMQYTNSYYPMIADLVKPPYFMASYNGSAFIMFRTDYLATINNLSSPLVKTDQHALQVRYEITN